MPAYYRRALVISEAILTLYFLAVVIILTFSMGQQQRLPILIPVLMLCCFLCVDRMSARENLFCVAALIAIWLSRYVHVFGWTAGSPNILVPILPLVFFNICIPPRGKIAYALGLILFRVLLFAYSLYHAPSSALNHASSMCLQVCNSVVPIVILLLNCILFSSSIQASERQLPLRFGETDFIITVGVEEYDFKSPTEAILDRADRKLYMGKVHGHDQVVA